MLSKFILFIYLLFRSGINAGSIGVVGLGRYIFEPLCCYASSRPFGIYNSLALQLSVSLLSKGEVTRSVTLLIPHI
jgi:hypothetical protein